MSYSDMVRTREDAESVPRNWFVTVEKSKEKADKLIRKVIAIDQSTSVVVGKLEGVEIDRLFHLKYPYCRLTMTRPFRYKPDGKFDFKMGDTELCFVNKPEMVLSVEELAARFPRIYDKLHNKIKTGTW